MIRLDIKPIDRHGSYAVSAIAYGPLIARTRTPLLDGARELLKRGASTDDKIGLFREGSTEAAMTATVGDAARWTVMENAKTGPRLAKWTPNPWTHDADCSASICP